MNIQESKLFSPAFLSNNIPVAFSTDEKYFLFLCVALKSLIFHSTEANNYDVIVLEEHLTEDQKDLILSVVEDRKNFSIRFINMTPCLAELGNSLFYAKMHWSRATYYRLCLPELLCRYEKVIYLDVDLVILADIGDLFHVDIQNSFFGCVMDPLVLSPKYLKYLKINFNFTFPYFNAGILLMNLEKIRECNIMAECLKMLHLYPDLRCPDQDALNIICRGHVEFLDLAWNYSNYWLPEFSQSHTPYSDEFKKIHSATEGNAKILHCIIKPWGRLDAKFADIWWSYAEQLPFSDQIRKTAMVYIKKELQSQQKKYDDILNSTAWKITLPLRIIFNFVKWAISTLLKLLHISY